MEPSQTLNHSITLADELGKGGEATVYNVARQPDSVAKLYHQPTPERAAKLRAMLLNPPEQPQTHTALAWPTALLYQQDDQLHAITNANADGAKGQIVGFLMPKITDRQAIFHVYNPVMRQQLPYPVDLNFLYRTAYNLAVVVSALHAKGYVIGDINESNILVNSKALVTLIDCDSFQVTDETGHIHRCPVGKPEFTPPELQGVSFKTVDQLPEHDLFGLGVLLFQLLMEGYHPFAGVLTSKASVGRVDLYAIRKGLFPYGDGPGISPPPAAPQFAWLRPQIQQLLLVCFEAGHSLPTARPDARAWKAELWLPEEALAHCKMVKQHRYSSHLDQCPYCEQALAKPSQPMSKAVYAHQLPELIAQTGRSYEQVNQQQMLNAYRYKDSQKTIEQARKVIQCNRYNSLAYYILGNSYYRKGEYARAVNALTTAIYRNYSPVSEAYYQRALVYKAKRAYHKALADVEQQLRTEQDPNRLHKGQMLEKELNQIIEEGAWLHQSPSYWGIAILFVISIVATYYGAIFFFPVVLFISIWLFLRVFG